MKALNPLLISGREVLPLVEGGKGISVSNGQSSGAWAAAGGVGTFSGVNADFYDERGKLIPVVYKGKTRSERHEELVAYGIRGGIAQARIAHDMSGGKGISVSNGESSGAWAAAGGVGTFSGVNADSYDGFGHRVEQI